MRSGLGGRRPEDLERLLVELEVDDHGPVVDDPLGAHVRERAVPDDLGVGHDVLEVGLAVRAGVVDVIPVAGVVFLVAAGIGADVTGVSRVLEQEGVRGARAARVRHAVRVEPVEAVGHRRVVDVERPARACRNAGRFVLALLPCRSPSISKPETVSARRPLAAVDGRRRHRGHVLQCQRPDEQRDPEEHEALPTPRSQSE